jgi:mono/diheme cytochrome c family protein
VVPALKERAAKASDWRTRLHALWTLDGLESLDAATVPPALNDKSPFVRAAAIRLAERWLSEPNHPLQPAVLKLMKDSHWQVRRQLAASLGAFPKDARLAPVAEVLEKYGADPVTVDAALSGIASQESAMLSLLIERKLTAQQGEDAVAMLAGAVARGRDLAATGRLFDLAAEDNRAGWQRVAVLRGVDLGLPGGGAGARGGGARGGFGRGGPGGGVSFPTEPVKLTGLAATGSGELGELARRISARVTWPGKPTPRIEVMPLTPDEQKRFEAGRQLYANVCAGCHQENGQGKEKMGPALAGSRWVTGNPAVAIRILVSGKEGPNGMMPPFASSLKDDQLADVITYLRRAWGHTASPVSRPEVTEIRGLTASRKTPYSEEELARFAGGFRGPRAGQ